MGGQRGSVLILVTLLALVAADLLLPGLQRCMTEAHLASIEASSNRAFQLAEAGLDQTISNLRTIDASDDVYTGALSVGTFTIQEPLTVLAPLHYQVSVTGSAGGIDRTVEAVLTVQPLSLFRFAMFGDEGVTIEGETRIDSYDSRNGPYDPVTNANGNGNVGTNANSAGAIDLNGTEFFIDGQLSVGPDVAVPESVVDGFDPDLISGSPPVVSQPEYPLPQVTVPAGLSCNDFSIQGAVVWTLPSPGVYCYQNLKVKGGATLTSDGPVTIYLVNTLDLAGDSTIGVVNQPTKFLFLMASGSSATIDGTIAGDTRIYGSVYGPDATIAISGNAAVYGSVVGNRVTMEGDAQLHYDEALADDNSLSNEGIVTVRSWRDRE